ncbi:MAG: ABC transporter permease [Bryobacteraceae bacterium]|jgi:ABC-type polysaccharide/polyol phosphate export permease
MWSGDFGFVLENLVFKDFKVRYRNMSLGVFWSLLNPLITMSVLFLVFGIMLPNGVKGYPVFVLCGLIPFNFFSIAWATGTNSLVDNAGLIKRVPIPREVVPIASVLANCLHLLIQIGMLLTFVMLFGYGVNRHWMWLPVVWGLEIVFVLGLVLACSALDVYLRDMRYLVESTNVLLFWLVPIVYGYEKIPAKYSEIYSWNPIAAMVMALRRILMDGAAPGATLIGKLALGSVASLAMGWMVFRALHRRFYDHL